MANRPNFSLTISVCELKYIRYINQSHLICHLTDLIFQSQFYYVILNILGSYFLF